MKKSESRSSSFHRSRHASRSVSRERDRDRERDRERRRNKDRDRDRDRERERDRKKNKNRDRDRDYYSHRRRSKSRSSRTSKSKKKKSKRSCRSSSSDSSSSRSSSISRSSRTSVRSSSSLLQSHTRPPSSDGNSSSMHSVHAVATAAAKPIDLDDFQIKAVLETIDEDSFVAQEFYSTRNREAPEKISDKVIIDLKTDTVTISSQLGQKIAEDVDTIFHPKFLGDSKRKMEKWTKKLYNYRQKSFHE